MAESESKSGSWMMTYIVVYAIILALTITTFGVSMMHNDLGRTAHMIVALLIAFTQAFLLAYFLMHLKDGDSFTWLLVGATGFWLVILFVFLLTDYVTRDIAAL